MSADRDRDAALLIQAAENAERLLSDLTNAPIASGVMRANIIIARNNLRDALRAAGSSHQPDGVHTIPVPNGWSPEQAWEAIRRGDELTDSEPSWVNIRIVGGRFVEVCDAN